MGIEVNLFWEQGFGVKETKLYQDNMSSILLEKNGRSSSTKRTWHMEIRYFFIKDRVASGELSIEDCPTEEMVADYFTKPLQGAQFKTCIPDSPTSSTLERACYE